MKRLFVPVTLMLLIGPMFADETLFDPDPKHIWNRLHRQLYSRTTPEGKVFDHEGLEPVFVRRSKFLTAGHTHEVALQRLDDFLAQDAHALIDDPVRRAILQRDLWAVFGTTASPTLPGQPQRRELQKRLAQAMRKVALSAKQIQQLPDNLTKAAKSGDFAADYQPQHPERPFLPVNLWQSDGPWVLVRSRLRRDNLAAPLHVEATAGRSVFFLFLRLPGGRSATLDYLRRLKELPKNTEIPQIPVGTQVALLRQMMLVDSAGQLRRTPVTESLQLRVYRTLKTPDMFEWSLRRSELMAGRGGLQPTAPDEINYFDIGFLGFELNGRQDPFETQFPPVKRISSVVMKSCVHCHAGPGIFGFQSMFADHFDRPPLDVTELKEQVTPVVERTHRSYAWGLLQGLWETETAR